MGEISILSIVWHAGVVVKLVMLILIGASVASWTVIMQRNRSIKEMWFEFKSFEQRFWSGIDLHALYNELSAQEKLQGLALVFHQSFSEFLKLRKQNDNPDVIITGIERAWHISQTRQIEQLERHLNLLATVGSTSPYVGLFGTVWGIMTSFTALGGVQQATIAMVAPGISEALIATAMGLLAAIPAVVAYNRFSNEVGRLSQYYDTFQEEFINILYRQLHAREKEYYGASQT